MARDEAIFEAVQGGAAPPTLRLYRWSPPCLSLGAFQSATQEVDERACRDAGVDLVRRPSGGRAILHDHELTYSVAAAVGALGAGDSVLESYHLISTALIRGLRAIGVEATLAPLRTRPIRLSEHSAACFDAPSDYEVLAGGRKLVGSAQLRRGPYLLQHGSILISFAVEPLLRLLRLNDEARRRWERQMAEGVTDLQRQGAGDQVTRLPAALVAGFSEILGAVVEEATLTLAEQARSRALATEKYAARSWTFRR
jgi:lipoate-protein ligase A